MRYRLTLEYDGGGFCGWQAQEGQITVQGVLEQALNVLLKTPIPVQGCGRTDTGVHALEQVAHFDVSQILDCSKTMYSLNALVRPYPVCVQAMTLVPNTFYARFSAIQRTYIYKIQNTPFPPILNQGKVWHIPQKLDVPFMNQVAQNMVGKHDFSAFRGAGCQAKTPLKTLDFIHIFSQENDVIFQIGAKSFLYHQVRNMVGSLVLLGLHKWTADDFMRVFTEGDRTKAGPTAPPEGLYFTHVIYPPEFENISESNSFPAL